ncbi:MAG: TIM barrel protein, partial [Planctomycetales bacterium]|nr:TIM barrel protein [Planctomycetales bacterium]
MKFAICNETFQDWSHADAFRAASAAGYTGIEFAPFTLATTADQVTTESRQEICRLLAEHGLECVGTHWLLAKTGGFYLTSPDVAVRERTGAYFRSLAQLTADLGGKIMVLGSPQQRNLLPGVTNEQAMEFAADVIRHAVPLF